MLSVVKVKVVSLCNFVDFGLKTFYRELNMKQSLRPLIEQQNTQANKGRIGCSWE